jgi:hypothetical protein
VDPTLLQVIRPKLPWIVLLEIIGDA